MTRSLLPGANRAVRNGFKRASLFNVVLREGRAIGALPWRHLRANGAAAQMHARYFASRAAL
jgi:hypothetical protein